MRGADSLAAESVLVTGAGTSVGRVMAEQFAAAGARVHICDVDEESVAAVTAAHPGIRGTVANVGSADQVAGMFADARAWLGEITVLVNAVGIGGPRAAIEDISPADWYEVMAVNVGGMFYCIREAAPAMKAARRGAIVNFSSSSTRTGLPMRTPYVVSKFAVEGLTRNLARELGPHNVRINAVLPGVIDNERMRGIMQRSAHARHLSLDEVEREYLAYISMRTKVTPEEIADMVLYLASEAARHVTGQLIGIDGNAEWEV